MDQVLTLLRFLFCHCKIQTLTGCSTRFLRAVWQSKCADASLVVLRTSVMEMDTLGQLLRQRKLAWQDLQGMNLRTKACSECIWNLGGLLLIYRLAKGEICTN